MTPYYINLDIETKERFDLAKFMEYTDNFDPLTSFFLHQLKAEVRPGGQYVVTTANRPELISYQIFNDVFYWWLILVMNQKRNVEDLNAGEVLVFPHQEDLETIYFDLRAAETSGL